MRLQGRIARLTQHLPGVYSAAVAASADRASAERIAERVLIEAARSDCDHADTLARDLVNDALRSSVITAPAPGFAPMRPGDREAVVLARLGGLSAADVAAVLGIGVDEAQARMLRGLRSAAVAAETKGCDPDPLAEPVLNLARH